ncbi:MAG TPA: hypothetical protein PLA85_09500 [Micropepsaceae bacterium]|nr:hypothetical protein [Micropepsaceae bacterium]
MTPLKRGHDMYQALFSIGLIVIAAGVSGCSTMPLSDGGKANCAAATIAHLPQCVEGRFGIVLASGAPEEELAAISGAADAGVLLWERYFGGTPPRASVVLGDITDAELARLQAAGFQAILPWRSRAMFMDDIGAQVRAQLAEKLAGQPQEVLDRAYAAAMAQAEEKITGRSAASLPVPHELGHLWLKVVYWQGAPDDGVRRYGTPAADWLDEAAALLMEDETYVASRYAQLRELDAQGSLIPLAQLVSMEHPLFRPAQDLVSEGGGTTSTTVRILTGEEAALLAQQTSAGSFYAQIRAFADFLIAQSEEERIFAVIAKAEAGGTSFPDWLAEHGEAFGLAGDMDLLEVTFLTWLHLKLVSG